MGLSPIVVPGPTSGSLQTTYAHNLGVAPASVVAQSIVVGTTQGAGAVSLMFPCWDATYVYMEWSDFNLTALLTITLPASSGAGGWTGAGYTVIEDVCAFFPTFTRNGPKGPADTDIQNWIADVAAKIDAILQRRFQEAYQTAGFTAWRAAFSTDQLNVLEHINHAGACAELASALVTSGIASAQRVADRFEKEYETEMRKLNARDQNGKPLAQGGDYDYLFDSQAKVETPRPQLGGFAGGKPVFKLRDRRES